MQFRLREDCSHQGVVEGNIAEMIFAVKRHEHGVADSGVRHVYAGIVGKLGYERRGERHGISVGEERAIEVEFSD